MGLFNWLFTKKEAAISASPVPATPAKGRIDLSSGRYNQVGGTRAGDGLYHLDIARNALKAKDFHNARVGYLKSVESWKQANEGTNQWSEELSLAKAEYSNFVQQDPLYLSGLNVILPLIKSTPGTLQTELYKLVDLQREDISYILYFAADRGVIERTKKGRTYQLRAIQ